MRRVNLGFVLAAGFACVWGSPAVAEVEKGFAPIFNGRDLSGWEGEAGYWLVEDGAITGITTKEKPLRHPSYLFWQGGQPSDFILRADYRFVSEGGNSGINFRSLRLAKWDILGYQADMATNPRITGILYECNQRAVMSPRGEKIVIDEKGKQTATTFADSDDLQKHIKTGDWNRYEIIARGPEIVLKINGVLMTHVVDRQQGKAAAKGAIALQIHPGPAMKVQFKNLRIKETSNHGKSR